MDAFIAMSLFLCVIASSLDVVSEANLVLVLSFPIFTVSGVGRKWWFWNIKFM